MPPQHTGQEDYPVIHAGPTTHGSGGAAVALAIGNWCLFVPSQWWRLKDGHIYCTHQKLERLTGPWPWWPPFRFSGSTQQTCRSWWHSGSDVGEKALGIRVYWGCFLIVSGDDWNDNTFHGIRLPPFDEDIHNTQPKTGCDNEG